jgi:hypothetical protein
MPGVPFHRCSPFECEGCNDLYIRRNIGIVFLKTRPGILEHLSVTMPFPSIARITIAFIVAGLAIRAEKCGTVDCAQGETCMVENEISHLFTYDFGPSLHQKLDSFRPESGCNLILQAPPNVSDTRPYFFYHRNSCMEVCRSLWTTRMRRISVAC